MSSGPPNGSDCTYGSGSCGGVIFSATDNSASGSGIDWSWWGNYAKYFVSNLFSKGYWQSELGKGGCYATFLQGAEQADPFGANFNPASNPPETAINAYAATNAAKYAAGQGLTVPLRSSAVRGILDTGATAAEAAGPALAVVQSSWGLQKEVRALKNGECH